MLLRLSLLCYVRIVDDFVRVNQSSTSTSGCSLRLQMCIRWLLSRQALNMSQHEEVASGHRVRVGRAPHSALVSAPCFLKNGKLWFTAAGHCFMCKNTAKTNINPLENFKWRQQTALPILSKIVTLEPIQPGRALNWHLSQFQNDLGFPLSRKRFGSPTAFFS